MKKLLVPISISFAFFMPQMGYGGEERRLSEFTPGDFRATRISSFGSGNNNRKYFHNCLVTDKKTNKSVAGVSISYYEDEKEACGIWGFTTTAIISGKRLSNVRPSPNKGQYIADYKDAKLFFADRRVYASSLVASWLDMRFADDGSFLMQGVAVDEVKQMPTDGKRSYSGFFTLHGNNAENVDVTIEVDFSSKELKINGLYDHPPNSGEIITESPIRFDRYGWFSGKIIDKTGSAYGRKRESLYIQGMLGGDGAKYIAGVMYDGNPSFNNGKINFDFFLRSMDDEFNPRAPSPGAGKKRKATGAGYCAVVSDLSLPPVGCGLTYQECSRVIAGIPGMTCR